MPDGTIKSPSKRPVATRLTGETYLEIMDELIRLDIPILVVGASSIGKSYSLTKQMEKYGMNGEFLFIGSEKSEYIEGIPNLRGDEVVAGIESTAEIEGEMGAGLDKNKFTYLKPFWFPNPEMIRAKLKRGQAAMKKNAPELFDNLDDYDALVTYKKTLQRTDDAIEENEDELSYISMLQGYGNFWLMLDEVDKVEEYDRDKFAPLLHIVRERMLKGWTLQGMNKFNNISNVESITRRKELVDLAIDRKQAIFDKDGTIIEQRDVPEGVDNITDTRIIAIANYSKQITEGALVRRFVHFIVDKSLYNPAQVQEKVDMLDADKVEALRRAKMHECLAERELPPSLVAKLDMDEGATVGESMAEPDWEDLTDKLEELNLQWTLGFIPDMLFPQYPPDGREPSVIRNLFVDNINSLSEKSKTQNYLKKVFRDNFIEELADLTNECVVSSFQAEEVQIDNIKELSMSLLDKIPVTDYDDPDQKAVLSMIEEYKKAGENYLKRLADRYHSQTDKEKEEGSFEVQQSDYAQLEDWIKVGTKVIDQTIQESYITALTSKLIASIPLVQRNVIGSSPYIYERDQLQYVIQQQSILAGILVMKGSGATIGEGEDVMEIGKTVAENLVVDESLLNAYGYGMDDKTLKKLEEFKKLADEGNEMEDKGQKLFKEVLANSGKTHPVLVHPTISEYIAGFPEVGKAFLESTTPFIEKAKEVYGNLLTILDTYKNQGMAADTANVPYYIEMFPYRCEKFFKDEKLGFASDKDFMDFVNPLVKEAKKNDTGMEFDKILNK